MKKRMMAIAFAACFLSLGLQARAGVFNTGEILKPGHFALGLEPDIYFDPSAFEFFIHGDLGLVRTIELDMALGLGTWTYFGADVDFGLIPDTHSTPALSFAVGAHGMNNLGLDATLTLSKNFRTFTLFGALDADVEFVRVGPDADNNSDHTDILLPLYIDLGVSIPFARQMCFILEGNIGVTSPANSNLSGGVKFYF